MKNFKAMVTHITNILQSIWAFPTLLVIFKLWLTSHLPVVALNLPVDALIYVEKAFEIFNFQTPFLYDKFVLLRQPGYPFFIRLSYVLGFSLRFSQELLYILSGLFLAWSLYKYYKNKTIINIFLVLFIFTPASFFFNRLTFPQVIYLPLTSFIISCLIHLLNQEFQSKSFLKWSVFLGLGVAWFWNTRPEGMLIVPTVAILYIIVIFKVFCKKIINKQLICKQVALSLACVLLPVFAVTSSLALTTYLKFGIFDTNDLTSSGIKSAYSRLTSVSPENWKYYVPVPKATRNQIYAVSPSFQKLSNYLENKGQGWFDGCKFKNACTDDYPGGWFLWALRDAVADIGGYKSAPATEAFYKQITAEIDAACQNSKLNCKRSNLAVPTLSIEMRREYIKPFFESLNNQFRILITEVPRLNFSYIGGDINFRKQHYEKATRESAEFLKIRSQPLNLFKDKLINLIYQTYKFIFPVLIGISLLSLIWQHFICLKYTNRATNIPLSIIWILLSCILIRIFTIAYIDATSFPGGIHYLWPIVPLILMIIACSLSEFYNYSKFIHRKLFKTI